MSQNIEMDKPADAVQRLTDEKPTSCTEAMLSDGVMSILFVACLAVTTAVQADLVIDGWFNCSANTFDPMAMNGGGDSVSSTTRGGGLDVPMAAQCALIQAPLCHKDVCSSNKTIELFVKRVLSSTASPKSVPDVWFIQGGPGASSEAMEEGMQVMLSARSGNVNVYTVDHRGTGRSNKFDCVAAQATTSGSPGGESITPQEFAACSADLTYHYGNDLSAFSITSAASDIAMLIKVLKSEVDSYVYGVSYGTAVVERLIHLNVTGIAGYILDGVATTSGAAPAERFEYFSTWDVDYGLIGDRFLDLCQNDSFCGSKFGSKGPAQTLKELYARLDSSEEGAYCAGLPPRNTSMSEPVSSLVRKTLAQLLQGPFRQLIPALVYRMDRCSPHDIEVVQKAMNVTAQLNEATSGGAGASYQSPLLYQLIVFSEMWELPPPRKSEMQKRFTDQLIASANASNDVSSNCLYRMDKESPSCQELTLDWESLPNGTRPIAYARDKYWNVSAKVPEGASVLIMNGKLDPQTHYRYAEYLYEAIDARPEQKRLLLFEYLGHGVAFLGDELNETPCGVTIMASYVENGGKLASTDTECMQRQAPLTFRVNSSLSMMLGTDDAFEGKLMSDSARGGHSTKFKTYRTLFIVFTVLFGICLVIIGMLVCSLRTRRRQEETTNYAQATDV